MISDINTSTTWAQMPTLHLCALTRRNLYIYKIKASPDGREPHFCCIRTFKGPSRRPEDENGGIILSLHRIGLYKEAPVVPMRGLGGRKNSQEWKRFFHKPTLFKIGCILSHEPQLVQESKALDGIGRLPLSQNVAV